MANTTAAVATSDVIGPVPFKDHCGAMPLVDFSTRTSDDDKLWLHRYQGTWVSKPWVPGIVAIQRSFMPRHSDIVLASPPKCGTTWLKALAFATMARSAYPPPPAARRGTEAEQLQHPLFRLNPQDCIPLMEMLFAAGRGAEMDALPSPRLMGTHMQHSILPASISQNPDCKIVYICREPKDMLVSLWHFMRRGLPDVSFSDVFEAACDGRCLSGPIWDHVLGYWNASKASPEKVLFLRYEEMQRDPVGNVRKLALFVGQPFSADEEEAGVDADIVRLCSFDTLRNLQVNSAGSDYSSVPNDWFFRKGHVGDWVNHMTPDMAQRLDTTVEEKLRGSGLTFM